MGTAAGYSYTIQRAIARKEITPPAPHRTAPHHVQLTVRWVFPVDLEYPSSFNACSDSPRSSRIPPNRPHSPDHTRLTTSLLGDAQEHLVVLAEYVSYCAALLSARRLLRFLRSRLRLSSPRAVEGARIAQRAEQREMSWRTTRDPPPRNTLHGGEELPDVEAFPRSDVPQPHRVVRRAGDEVLGLG